ncbi:MAG: hypothetical protein A3C07_02280 [Candidatus Sungbacteria bacterium RIFCSPHIGHO2_02_FULL_47_11]|uniref:Uncharacterized protein n=1 Tax=Candidatus Sungbacteria bacterium RIFCSPHIGHO2_02_FULL_47_11 TaxID=1802270 RepID=A0A1G2KN92_9BACT|nr:MAG: hypothetical protein A3C07_02280 [Candidatus Sungbacteria bacterium RIFCSPHIGHO2_02_FULL_47_11]
MPAVVSRTEGSSGIKEDDGTTVWPFFLKKSRNFFRRRCESISLIKTKKTKIVQKNAAFG